MEIKTFDKATELIIEIEQIERILKKIISTDSIRFYGKEAGYIHETEYEPLVKKYMNREINKLKTKLNQLKKEFKELN